MKSNVFRAIQYIKRVLAGGLAVAFLSTFTACSGPEEVKTNYEEVSPENLKPVQLNFYVMHYMEKKILTLKKLIIS
ncbi:MAG TPA: hypothetical protein PK604_11750 [Acetivibrio clariflavus]|nr:hypothetical protein [Acetivibrio clariflavus]HPU42079.1 hypothetical protein [Acetivibrio clariflavus]